MPLSSTPLSGCPLRRLEIHDGSTCTVHDALQSERALTATLEAQRSMRGDKNDLVLQSHSGITRVLSIQLTDLLPSSGESTEIVTVDKPSQKLSIQNHQKQHRAIFSFQQSRDFNLFIYTLRKFGFRVKDDIGLSANAGASSLARSQSYPTPAATNSTPRLSAITPLQIPGSLQSQSPFSFTSLLNSEIPLADLHFWGTQDQQPPLQSLSQQPDHLEATGTIYAPYQSSYQLYLGHHSTMYQPRVSSPLRNAVGISSRDSSPVSSASHSQSSVLSSAVATAPTMSHRCVSEPYTSLQIRQQPECLDMNSNEPSSSQDSLSTSQDTISSAENDSQTTDEPDVLPTLQPLLDFRELMPRTRSLPFIKDGKSKPSKTKPVRKRANTGDGRSSSNTSTPMREIESIGLYMDSPNASPTSQQPTSSQPTDITEISLISHPCCEVDELPSMLVTDSGLLEKINRKTGRLLDQYEADIGRGCDSAACAQFYLEQIDMVRRDFWLDSLIQSDQI